MSVSVPTTNSITEQPCPLPLRVLLCLMLLSLAGCSDRDKLPVTTAEYAERLARVLDQPPPPLPDPQPVVLPSAQSLRHTLTANNLTLLEFQQLQQCDAGQLLAQRNSVLGKVRLASSDYQYEAELLSALQRCLLNDNDPVSSKLDTVINVKKQQRPKVWANLIQTSNEIQQALGYGQGYVIGRQQDGLAETREALLYLLALALDPEANTTELEHHLQQLSQFNLPARMWRSQNLLATQLPVLTQWLDATANAVECANNRPSTQAEYLHNVFNLFFIQQLQPAAGALSYYHFQLESVFEQLISHPWLDERFVNQLQQLYRDEFNQYQAALSEHVALWQGLLKRCGLSPG